MAPRRIGPERLPMLRAGAQLLHRPSGLGHPADVVREAAFIQAQDPQAARLGIRSRSPRLTAADADAARAEGSLLRGWAMRGTLHLFPADDAPWLLSLFSERELAWARRRLHELMGLDRRAQDRAVARLRRLFDAREAPVPRTEVVAELQRAGYDTGSNAIHHLGRLPVLTGDAFLGPDEGTRTTYVSARAWLGDRPAPPPRDAAMEELARRHLRGFGPADERDMSAWSGIGLRECRAAMDRLGSELAEVRVGGERKWVVARAPRRAPRKPLVRMLGAFDNHLMGHGNRDIAVPAPFVKRVWPGAGIVRATVLVDGVARATWKTQRTAEAIRITIEPFEQQLEGSLLERIEREVADVGRFEASEARLAAA